MKRIGLALLILTAVNLVAHFIPFERASLATDSLARLTGLREGSLVIRKELQAIDRPLEVFHYLLFWLTGENPFLWVFMVFLTSSLLTWTVFLVLRRALDDSNWAFLGTLFYTLLPNKLELYYTADYSNHNAFSAAYLLSLILFGLFVQRGQRRWLGGSLLSYTVGVFWNELGFFLPAVHLLYALLADRRRLWGALLFAVPALVYTGWRLGLLVPPEPAAPPPRYDLFFSHTFVQLPHLYLGRQMAKAVLYGLWRFPFIELPWLGMLLAADVIFLRALIHWLRGASLPKLGRKAALLSAAIFCFLILPGLLNWGVTGRNTALAAAGFSGLAMWVFSRLRRVLQVQLLAALCATGLFISQGTAWSQMEACRVNRAIDETLFQRKREILNSERVLMDQYSFSRRIPYTWVQDFHNQMDTYWGVSALLGVKGYPLLVHLAVGELKPVSIVRSAIERRGDTYFFEIYNPDTYALEEESVPVSGSFLLDYDAVYQPGRGRFPPGVRGR